MNPFNWIITIIKNLFSLIFKTKNKPKNDPKLYGLDHAILNVDLPSSMWMNMGYWEHETNLPNACKALLDQVLMTAGFLDKSGHPTPNNNKKKKKNIHLLDVGFGCGDQSIYLTNLSYSPHAENQDEEGSTRGEEGAAAKALFSSYTGITISQSQAAFAQRRMGMKIAPSMQGMRIPTATPLSASQGQAQTQAATPNIRLFCADAAKPESWGEELNERVNVQSASSSTSTSSSTSVETSNIANKKDDEKWLLALDTLYHFSPSRLALLTHASTHLHASLMAFDLILADNVSSWNKFLLRLICVVTGSPMGNFITWGQYEDMLVKAGYDRERIEVRDVSSHVFGGIADFIRRKDEELKMFGMGVGKFKGAGMVFGWWGRSGIVRGKVIVARK